VVIGKKRNQTVIEFLKSDRPCILACPWSPGASYALEIIDRLVSLPRLIPSQCLTRTEDVRKIYTSEPWIIVKIDTSAKAAMWRSTYKTFFEKDW